MVERVVAGSERVSERLAALEEELRDLAYERLRAAAEGDEQAAADEKRLLTARRAVARALAALGAHGEADVGF
jgi:hypothetical protein